MKRRLLNGDTGAALGLIAGIILGSLALNLSGLAEPPPVAGEPPPQRTPTTSVAVVGSAGSSAR